MEWPLSGLRVADLSAGIAGGYCAKALRARDLPPQAAAGDSQRDTPEALSFAGLRVADFTMNWAGPIVSHVLAMYGADVIHVESLQRPDSIRFQSVRPMTEDRWREWAPLYNEDILSGLPGLSAGEIAQLGRDGIIGTRPASTDSSRGFT